MKDKETRNAPMFTIGDIFEIKDHGVVRRGLIVGIIACCYEIDDVSDYRYTYITDSPEHHHCADIFLKTEECLECDLKKAKASLFGQLDISKVLRGHRENAIWFNKDFEMDEMDEPLEENRDEYSMTESKAEWETEEDEGEDPDLEQLLDIYKLSDDLQIAKIKIEQLEETVDACGKEIDSLKAINEKLRKENNFLFGENKSLVEENKSIREDNKMLGHGIHCWKNGWIEAFKAMGWDGSVISDTDISPEGDDRK